MPSNRSLTEAIRAPFFKRFAIGPSFPPDYNGSVTASSGAATLNTTTGIVTSESLSTAAGSAYTLTLTNSQVHASAVVLVSVFNGSNTAGLLMLSTVTPAAGSVSIVVYNRHATDALSGTIKIAFSIVNPA